jgi:hypothetical protein
MVNNSHLENKSAFPLTEELEQLSHLQHIRPDTVRAVRDWYALCCFDG